MSFTPDQLRARYERDTANTNPDPVQRYRIRLELDVHVNAWEDRYGSGISADDVADYVLELIEVCQAHAAGALTCHAVKPLAR